MREVMQEYPKHYCGVFGVFGHPNAAELTYYGLYALQHRGQESAGIVSSDGRQFRAHKGMGLELPAIRADNAGAFLPAMLDRKSTRLNSSHVSISYAA